MSKLSNKLSNLDLYKSKNQNQHDPMHSDVSEVLPEMVGVVELRGSRKQEG